MTRPARDDLRAQAAQRPSTEGLNRGREPARDDLRAQAAQRPRTEGLNRGRSLSRGMTIGEAASRSGVSAKMIRHYEAIGLIAAERRANNYRTYDARDVAVLRFIRHARDLAFPLEDVRKLLALWRDRGRASGEVKRLALDHVQALEAKAAALNAMAGSLRHLAQHCAGDDRPECPILEELGGASA